MAVASKRLLQARDDHCLVDGGSDEPGTVEQKPAQSVVSPISGTLLDASTSVFVAGDIFSRKQKYIFDIFSRKKCNYIHTRQWL